MKITFGKYKGTDISAIPTDYLEWGVDKLESPKWRQEFETELKRRNDEIKKQEDFIKQNIGSDKAWQILIKEAEAELAPSDDENDYRIIRQSDIEALAKEKLQKYQAEVELEKLDSDFMKKWGVNKSQIDKIQDEFWSDGLKPSMFSSQEKYEAACELATKRDNLIGKIYSL